MKPLEHIERLLADTHAIQNEGHCNGNAPAWVAINDMEIKVHDLRIAFEKNQSSGFPDIITWQNIVVREDDDRQYKRKDFYDYYKTKYEICLQAKPISIAEIGVRWGYSAYSFLSAVPGAFYCGFDIIAGTHGGAKGVNTFDYVYELLGNNFPNATVILKHCDTRKISRLGGPFDFVHVDGDHGEAGCYHDLELALMACRPGGMILVDDYNYIRGVTAACERFADENAGFFTGVESRHSLRGEFILRKK